MGAKEQSEALEAMVRHAMAEHAAIEPRGFDTIRERANLHRDIDMMLDEWAIIRDIAQVDTEAMPA